MGDETAGEPDLRLPTSGATYVLICAARVPAHVRVGRLGVLALQAGGYVYVGSALGSGGLRARLGRHLRVDTPARWHFDYSGEDAGGVICEWLPLVENGG